MVRFAWLWIGLVMTAWGCTDERTVDPAEAPVTDVAVYTRRPDDGGRPPRDAGVDGSQSGEDATPPGASE